MPGSGEGSKSNSRLTEMNQQQLLNHYNKLHHKYQKAKANLEKSTKSCADSESKFRKRLDEVLNDNEDLRSKLAVESGARSDLETRIKDLETRNDELKATLNQLQKNSANLDEFNEATNDLNLLKEDKRELLAQLDKLESTQETALQLEKHLAKLLDENKQLSRALEESNEKTANLETELRNQCDESGRYMQELLDKLMQAELQLDKLEKETQEFKSNERRMQCRIEAFESNEKTLTANHDNDQAHIFQLSDSLEKASQEEIQAKNELHKLKSRVREVISRLSTGLRIIFDAQEPQIERFVCLSCDTIELLLELSPVEENAEDLKNKFKQFIEPTLEKFIRSEEQRRNLELENQSLALSYKQAKEQLESLQAVLSVEKNKRHQSEKAHLEITEEYEILKSTLTALTNQLEDTQLKLEQMMNSATEANSTDDDKNSSDEARTESQLAALRERIATLESELESEKALREEEQASLAARSASLTRLQQRLDEKETELVNLKDELSRNHCRLQDVEKVLETKSQLIESLHFTINDLVDKANRSVFAHPDDNCGVACKLLRLLEQLSQDFAKQEDIGEQVRQMKTSDDDPMETCLRVILQRLIASIKSCTERDAIPVQSTTLPDKCLASTAAGNKDIMLKERDEKIVKLKNLLVKMKKELVEVKGKQTLLANNMQSLQTEYDKVVDSFEAEKATGNELQRKITQTMDRVAEMELQLSRVNDEKRQMLTEIERLQVGLASADAVKAETEAQLLVAQDELEKSRAEVNRLRDELSQHIQQATALQVEISLLQQQVEKNRNAIDDANQMTERSKQMEEAAKQAKDLVEKLVIEKAQCEVRLNEVLSRAADADELARARERLEAELDDGTNKLDEALRQIESLELCSKSTEAQVHELEQRLSEARRHDAEKSGEIQQLREQLQSQRDSQSRLIRTLEGKANTLKKDYQTVSLELQDSKKQFEAYKLKVHSMMKTRKDPPEKKVEAKDSADVSALKVTIERLTVELEASKRQLEASQQDFARIQKEYNCSREDLKTLVEQSKVTFTAAEVQNEKKVLQVELEARHQSEIEDLRAQHEAEIETRELSNRHLVEVLEEKLLEARTKLERLQENSRNRDAAHSSPVLSNTNGIHTNNTNNNSRNNNNTNNSRNNNNNNNNSNSNTNDSSINHNHNHNHNNSINNNNVNHHNNHNLYNNDVFLESPVRQPAEGSESSGSAPTLTSLPWEVIPSSGLMPLSKLLENQEIPSYESVESIMSNLEDATKRIDHFTELLNESEVNNLRLSEQVRLLKEEVRRLERNKEREEQFGNLEYLKNVVLKYLTMRSERERLVPVLVTMLKLSPDERRLLQEGDQGWGLLPKFL